MTVKIGDLVMWSTSKKPLGIVVEKFYHKHNHYAVIEKANGTLIVTRIYEALEVVEGQNRKEGR